MMRDSFGVYIKGSVTNVVTDADIAVQSFLYRELTSILPGSGFLGEEENMDDTGHSFVWIVDPIDGTANFSRRIPECAISVALCHEGDIILGVVYNPYHDWLFSAVKGGGAFMNDTPLHVSDRSFDNGILLTALSLYRKEYAKVCSDIIMDAYSQCNDVRRYGSCALELCYLACGWYELYFEYRVMPWDYAAAYLILSEAGGILTARDGGQLHFDRPTLLIGANNKDNHNKLVQIVSRHTHESLYEQERE